MDSGLKERKLNYRFHNPNTPEVTVDFLIKLFTEVNMPKVEAAIREAQEAAKAEKGIYRRACVRAQCGTQLQKFQ